MISWHQEALPSVLYVTQECGTKQYMGNTSIISEDSVCILLTKSPAKLEEYFPIPDLRGDYDTHCCDFNTTETTKILTANFETRGYGHQAAECLPVPVQDSTMRWAQVQSTMLNL
jgi:hypothetical protein